MMKRLFVLFYVIFIPFLCYGDMVGWSGDTRRYVTEEEKTRFPYNTVVRIYGNGIVGTGTFVSEDVILTCAHVVEDAEDSVKHFDYYTSDGRKHSGTVGAYVENYSDTEDFAFAYDVNAFNGHSLLSLSPNARYSDNLTIIGYDNLKPLSKDELTIIKKVYINWIKTNGKITNKNATKAMARVNNVLKREHACSSGQQTNCVHCSDDELYCIFGDNKYMKVRTGCKVTRIDDEIYTNCPGARGSSGSAIIDANSNEIIGVFCGVNRLQIGQEKDATGIGVKPEVYYDSLQTWINGIKKSKNK